MTTVNNLDLRRETSWSTWRSKRRSTCGGGGKRGGGPTYGGEKMISDKCECGAVQNTVHLRQCALVGDGKGTPAERTRSSVDRAVADFLV